PIPVIEGRFRVLMGVSEFAKGFRLKLPVCPPHFHGYRCARALQEQGRKPSPALAANDRRYRLSHLNLMVTYEVSSGILGPGRVVRTRVMMKPIKVRTAPIRTDLGWNRMSTVWVPPSTTTPRRAPNTSRTSADFPSIVATHPG